MLMTAVAGATLKLVLAAIALLVLRFALKGLDRKMEFDFKGWLNDASDLARSIYLAGRFIGACLLFGFIFS